MYGNRAKKGGDMFEQFNRFLNWAMSYEYSQSISGSRFETDKWALKFEDRVLYIDGSWPLYKKIKVIQKKLRSLPRAFNSSISPSASTPKVFRI
jgi:hypothetical protein